MYCRNCGNDVNDKAIACPKCGVNPKTEKNFCPACGEKTTPNQVVCTNCGVSLERKTIAATAGSAKEIEIGELWKNKKVKIGLLLAVFAVGIIYAYVKYASHLSNGKAEDLISQKLRLPSPVTEPVQHGVIRFSGWSDADVLSDFGSLQSKKIITCVEQQNTGYYSGAVYQISITPDGQKYKIADSSDVEGRQYYIMKAAEKTFGKILKLKESNDATSAAAEFSILYKNITPVGFVYGIDENGFRHKVDSSVVTYKMVAYFEKNDDGWRIKNIVDE